MIRTTAALAVLLTFAPALPAAAFVRTTTCRANANPVDPLACEAGERAIPIFWDRTCVVYHIARTGLPSTESAEAVYAAIRASFAEWGEVSCSFLTFVDGGFTNEDRVGYNSCDPSDNVNIVVFRDANWRHQRGALALTSVTYDLRNGEIVDADIELNNTGGVAFTTSNLVTQVNIDIANTVTHETGHFLGLDHSPIEDSTMFATAPRGELKKRDLHQDDQDGVCAIYPQGQQAGLSCDRSSVGFFEKPDAAPGAACKSDDDMCACAATQGNLGSYWGLALVGWGLLVLARRRARRRLASEHQVANTTIRMTTAAMTPATTQPR